MCENRAIKAVVVLINNVEVHHLVALVGHGFFNMMIAKELQNRGWIGRRNTDSNHWKCTTYFLMQLKGAIAVKRDRSL